MEYTLSCVNSEDEEPTSVLNVYGENEKKLFRFSIKTGNTEAVYFLHKATLGLMIDDQFKNIIQAFPEMCGPDKMGMDFWDFHYKPISHKKIIKTDDI